MKAVILTHSSTYESRAEAVGRYLEDSGWNVTYIESDFDHRTKTNIRRTARNHVYLHMAPYRRNISPGRLKSIRDFSRLAEKTLDTMEFDLLYVCIPANSLMKAAAVQAAKHQAKLVVDLIDLWPESLPLSFAEKLPAIQTWRRERDDYIGSADLIFTECGLYQELVDLPMDKTHTLYWFRGWTERPVFLPHADEGIIRIAYLGSINHIIDIKLIADLLAKIREKKRVQLHVIGDGESRDLFLDEVRKKEIDVVWHSTVYDDVKKRKILGDCDFGLNVMVESVRVGLTMKSLDYLAEGLPLINTIRGDTEKLIRDADAGILLDRDNVEAAADAVIAAAGNMDMHRNARDLYEKYFTEESFRETLAKFLPVESVPRPQVSVAMAAWNGEKYIGEQIDSILSQLTDTDELVISLDPSTDGTEAIIRRYEDPRIRLLDGPGNGVIANFENAIRNCRGEYIFLADQDDVWLPGKVERVKEAFRNREGERTLAVMHDAKIVDASLADSGQTFFAFRGCRTGMKENILKNTYIGCCMAFRRALLPHILPFPKEIPMHDQWIGLMAEKYGRTELIREPLLLYRRHGENATDTKHAGAAQMIRWRAGILAAVLKKR